MISAFVSILGINLLTSLFKNALSKYGDIKVHIIVFSLSVVATLIWSLAQSNPSIMTFLEHAAAIGAASVGTYEVIWKQIGKVVDTSTSSMSV